MKIRKIFKDLSKIVVSRGITTLSGVASGFLLPLALGVTGYGLLKVYTLYFVYTSLMHFGFSDGILLKFAGLNYQELNKKNVRTYSRFFILFQLLLSFVLMIIGLNIVSLKYRFIVIMLGINMVTVNATGFFQFISQATKRFSEYSARNIITALLKLIVVTGMFVVFKISGVYVSYKLYIIFLNIIDALLFLWYIFTYRDIVFGSASSFSICKNEIFSFFRIGIVLTLAYQIGHLVFALDRQFVSLLFDTDTYSVYAFAYSVVTLFTTLISSISVVVLPMLKRSDKNYILKAYEMILSAVSVISCVCLVFYFPLKLIIEVFLTDYVGSIRYLRVVLPALILVSCISTVLFTFYKIFEKNHIYLGIAISALVIGIVLNYGAYSLYSSPLAISWASVITLSLWYLAANHYYSSHYQVRYMKTTLYIAVNMMGFYLLTGIKMNWLWGTISFFGFTIIILLLFWNKEVKIWLQFLTNKNAIPEK